MLWAEESTYRKPDLFSRHLKGNQVFAGMILLGANGDPEAVVVWAGRKEGLSAYEEGCVAYTTEGTMSPHVTTRAAPESG